MACFVSDQATPPQYPWQRMLKPQIVHRGESRAGSASGLPAAASAALIPPSRSDGVTRHTAS